MSAMYQVQGHTGGEHELRRDILSRIIDASRRPHELSELLSFVLEEVERSIDLTWAAIWLFDREEESWYIAASRGLSESATEIRFPRGSALPCLVGERGIPLRIDDLDAERFLRFTEEHYRMRSALYAPMSIARAPVGVLAIYSDHKSAFADHDLAFLASIGNQVSIAVAFSALEEQRERMGILEERDRLAREFHDGILQAFSSIKLYAIETRKCLQDGAIGDAEDLLTRLEESLEEATTEVRGSITRLRTSQLYEDVAEVAKKTKQRLEASGIGTDLDLGARNLSGLVSDVLAWVCREAAHNILKHSHATSARIRLHRSGRWIELDVTDDGVGPPSADSPPDGQIHLGLQMIEERARQIGGELQVGESAEGGTRLTCRVPASIPNE